MTAQLSHHDLIAHARRLHEAGALAEARALYAGLLERTPDNPEVLHLAGVAAYQGGDHPGAVRLIHKALSRRPDFAPAWQNLVLPLLDLGLLEDAVAAGERAVTLAPEKAGVWTNYVLALIRAGRLDEAALKAEMAISIAPRDPAAWSQLGHIRLAQGHAEDAERILTRALALAPTHEEALYNHGVAAQTLMQEAAAEKSYRAVLAGNPGHRGARLNLGVALRSQGRITEALAVWRASKELPQDWPELAYDIACAHLLAGDWAQAWDGYELRFEATNPIVRPPQTDAPRWRGEALPGATLLVHHEQGLGDTIQFVRLLALVEDRVGRIALICQPPLHALLSTLPLFRPGTNHLLLREGDALPDHTAWTALLSLPAILRLDQVNLPRRAPYLSAPNERVASWAERLDALDRFPDGRRPFRVGLVWQGNPKAPVEKGRSIPLAHFAPLGTIPDVSFFALQKGVGREQPTPPGLVLNDLGPDFDTGPDAFLDTGAVLASLDLVITSDTSMAHVAGALGRPVWLLLKHVPDWRWGTNGRLMPWYPSMRVFRQPAAGDWDGVMASVRRELAVLAGLRRPDAATGAASFEAALAEHTAGRYAAAVPLYRQLAARKDDARVLNYLGMASFEAGARSLAAAQEALPLVLRSVGLGGCDADLFANLAVVLRQAGAPRDAREALAFALSFAPGHRSAGLNLINLDLAERRSEEALARAVDLAARFPADGGVLSAAASAAKALKRFGEAEAAARRAIAAEPRNARHQVLLGSILLEAGNQAGARKAWEEALTLDPRNPDALSNLGVFERNHGDGALAVWFVRRAVVADPRHAEAWCNLGIGANDRGRAAEGRDALRRSIAIRPDYAEARMALGMNLLAEGRLEEGLPEYEWRLRSEQLGLGLQPGRLAAWNGQEPRGRSFLLICEQGFGDAIQFVRYAALLKAAGAGKIILGCRNRLKALLGRADGVDGVVGEGEKLPEVDYFVPLMSLPALMGTRLQTIPAMPSYLTADSERTSRWAGELARQSGFRVGLIWQGNPDAKVDRGRSIPLAALEALARVPGVRLIALQKGPGIEQIEALAGRFPIETPGEDFDNGPDAFVDSAAVMMNLDLVVSTDTAAAHLAGALGRPVWLFVKALPEWRWFTGRSDSPWYPTMRLFRQSLDDAAAPPGAGAWAPVVARMAGELEKLVAGDLSRRLAPPGEAEIEAPAQSVARRFERAFAAHRAGDLARALPIYAHILLDEPDHAGALHMLGAMAVQNNAHDRGLFFLDAARAAGETTPELDTNRAVALRNLGRPEEAEALLRAVMDRAPSAEAALTLGNILRDRGEAGAALDVLSTAIALQPDQAKAHRARANALKDLGDLDDALAAFDTAAALAPDDADLRLDRAHALLYAGRLHEGFAEYEWRWRASELVPHGHGAPPWRGDAYPGRTLLIHGEQGLGDHIQFARFIPMAAARGGKVLLSIRRSLFGLLRSLDGWSDAIELVEQGGPVPPHDLQLPLLSLPYRLGIEATDLPGQIPYLAAEPDRVARWRRRLAGPARLKIGLVWQGNPKARADKGRSPPLAALAPLFDCRHVRFFSLQKDHGLDQLAGLTFAERIERPDADFDAGPDAFLDSAAAMTALDLIVTSDTAAAHLAGALGRPTLLMLKHAPDWRWQGRGTQSPWYPTLELMRQPKPGDWDAVAKAVATMIDARAGA